MQNMLKKNLIFNEMFWKEMIHLAKAKFFMLLKGWNSI